MKKLSKFYTETIRDIRGLYDQFYYLSKDLTFFQKRKLSKRLWKTLKKELNGALVDFHRQKPT